MDSLGRSESDGAMGIKGDMIRPDFLMIVLILI